MALMLPGPPNPPPRPNKPEVEGGGNRARVPETGFHGTGRAKDPLRGYADTAGGGDGSATGAPNDAAESATAAGRKGRGQVARRVPPGEPPRPPGEMGGRAGDGEGQTPEGTVRAAHPGSGAYRPPAAPGCRLFLPPGTERGERERRSERGSCSNPIPGAAAAAAAAASATAGEVT